MFFSRNENRRDDDSRSASGHSYEGLHVRGNSPSKNSEKQTPEETGLENDRSIEEMPEEEALSADVDNSTWKERITGRRFWIWLLIGALFLIPLGLLPMMSVYAANAESVPFRAVIRPALLSLLCYAGVYAVMAVGTARAAFSALMTGGSVFFLMNYGTLRGLFADRVSNTASYLLALLLALLLISAIAFLLVKLRRQTKVLNFLTLMLTCVFGFVLFNTVRGVGGSILQAVGEYELSAASEGEAHALTEEERKQAAAAALEKLAATIGDRELPNIYFFVFDEMAGFHSAETYYDYDLTDFKAFCDANCVNYSANSHSMYDQTYLALADLCSYTQYGAVNISGSRSLSANTRLNQALTGLGYNIFNMSCSLSTFQGVPNLMDSTVVRGDYRTEDGLSLEDIAYENSVMSMFLNGRESYVSHAGEKLLGSEEIISGREYGELDWYCRSRIDSVLSTFDFFENAENYIPHAGLAIFTYQKTTHVPFLFQADGTPITNSKDFRNWRDAEVYTGCYTYTLRHIEKMISTILNNDPYSVIVIQSDHGVRYHVDCTLSHLFRIEEEDEKNIMNLVYFEGKPLDIEGLSATDTVRLVLNLLGMEDLELEGTKTVAQVVG